MARNRNKDWYRVGAIDSTHTLGFNYESSCNLVLAIAGQQALDQYRKGYQNAKNQGNTPRSTLARAPIR